MHPYYGKAKNDKDKERSKCIFILCFKGHLLLLTCYYLTNTSLCCNIKGFFYFFFLIADELVFSSIKSYMRFCQKLVTDQISSLLAASVDVGPLSFQKYEIPLIYSFDFKNFRTIPFIFIYLDVPFKVLNTIKYFLISYSL